MDKQSEFKHCALDPPPLLDVLLLGDDGYPLRSEDGAGTDVLEEIHGASPEDFAELVEPQKLAQVNFLFEFRQVAPELLRGEEFEQEGGIDVFPAPFGVDMSYRRVEQRQDPVALPSFGQQSTALLHHPLRLVPAPEERVELVDQVGLAVLFGTNHLLFQGLLGPSFLWGHPCTGYHLDRHLLGCHRTVSGQAEVLGLEDFSLGPGPSDQGATAKVFALRVKLAVGGEEGLGVVNGGQGGGTGVDEVIVGHLLWNYFEINYTTTTEDLLFIDLGSLLHSERTLLRFKQTLMAANDHSQSADASPRQNVGQKTQKVVVP